MGTPCPQCSTSVEPGTKFCGQCGYDLVTRPPVAGGAAAAKPEPDPKKTMMGGFEPVMAPPKAPAKAPVAAEPPARDFAKTMMDAGPPPAAVAALQAQARADSAQQKPKKQVQRTMMGMAAVPPSAMAPAAPLKPPSSGSAPIAPTPVAPMPAVQPEDVAPKPKKAVQRTMLGIAATPSPIAQGAPLPSPAPAPSPLAPPSPGPQTQGEPVKDVAAQTNRTMLGVAAPPPGEVAAAAAAAAAGPQGSAPSPISNRTMLGQPATPSPGQAEQGAPQFTQPSDPLLQHGVPGLSRRRFPWVAVLITMGVLVGIAGGAGWYLFGRGPQLRASIAHGDEGEILQVDVPGTEEGTKAVFQGREAVLEAGRATFPLAANDLQLGDNTLTVDVVSPSGSVEQASVVLSVNYRVRADLASLESDPPTLRIVVDAQPGSSAFVDEAPVPLDDTGHGAVDLPIEPEGDAPTYERTISYRIVMGEDPPATGTVRTVVPFATLQIDRPGTNTVTDKPNVELAGAAHPEAVVTLDGTPLTTTEGRFVSQLEIAEVGERTYTLVARRPGRAPRAQQLRVQRVEDLAAHASSYPVDPALTYARITQNPESYRGQKAAFVGRVYNVDVHQGRTVLQIVARECPRGQRCPLWVTFDGASEAETNSWVRVLGEIGGEQQFRSPSGEVMTVPKLNAVFVLPAEAGRRR